MAASNPEDNLMSAGWRACRRPRIRPGRLRPSARTPLATGLILDHVPARVAPPESLFKGESYMAMGDTNRGLQNIWIDKNSQGCEGSAEATEPRSSVLWPAAATYS